MQILSVAAVVGTGCSCLQGFGGVGVPWLTRVNFTGMSKWMNINKLCLDALTQGKARENPGAKSNLSFEGSLYFEFCISCTQTYSCFDREVWNFMEQVVIIWVTMTDQMEKVT